MMALAGTARRQGPAVDGGMPGGAEWAPLASGQLRLGAGGQVPVLAGAAPCSGVPCRCRCRLWG